MRTAVVTDNNGGIYEEEGKKLGVRIVSMPRSVLRGKA